MNKHLHIISLKTPFPVDYGGVFDIYFKIVALHRAGIKIHLHCFTTDGAEPSHLSELCEKVFYYRRKTGIRALSTSVPYIVSSRRNTLLEKRLLEDDYPILAEGIHCTGFLSNPAFASRKVIIRLHNVEHVYYRRMIPHTNSLLKKIYFTWESLLLQKYEKRIALLPHLILAVSQADKDSYVNDLHARNVSVLPVFTGFDFTAKTGVSDYCFYHGNLTVPENEYAACWLVEHVFNDLAVTLVIAGKNPSKFLKSRISAYPHVRIVADPSNEELQELISNAQVHVLPSFNSTGVKLKLIHALYKGRHCIVNNAAIQGTNLDELCFIANTGAEMKKAVMAKILEPITSEELERRKSALLQKFDNTTNTDRLIQMIW